MTIEYVGGLCVGRVGSTSTTTQSLSGTLTGGLASSPSEGDLVIVTVVVGSSGRNPATAITTPTGYTALGALLANGTYDTSMNVSYKFMPATPDANFTVPSTGAITDAQRWTVQVFRGVDPTTPLDVTPVPATGTASGNCDPASITPATEGAWVVICGGGANNAGAAYTGPTNYTTNFLTGVSFDGIDAMVGSGYYTGWTTGAEDPGAYADNAASSWAAYTIALRPVDTDLYIDGILGTATASGYTAAVDQQYQVNGILGSASASGFLAEITSALNISGILGTADASGYTAAVDRQLGVNGTLGTATASGNKARVGSAEAVTAVATSPNVVAMGDMCSSNIIGIPNGYWILFYLSHNYPTTGSIKYRYIDANTLTVGSQGAVAAAVNRGRQFAVDHSLALYRYAEVYGNNTLTALVKVPESLTGESGTTWFGSISVSDAVPDGWSVPANLYYKSLCYWFYTVAVLHYTATALYLGLTDGSVAYDKLGPEACIANKLVKTLDSATSACRVLPYEYWPDYTYGLGCMYSDNGALYFKYYDGDTATVGSEEEVLASGLFRVGSFTFAITQNHSVVVFYIEASDTTRLMCRIRTGLVTPSWGTPFLAATLSTPIAAATANAGESNEVVFYYFSGGALWHNTITDGALGTASLYDNPESLLGEYDLQAPAKSIETFGVAYHLADNTIQLVTHSRPSVANRGVNGTYVANSGSVIFSLLPITKQITKFGDYTAIVWASNDMRAHISIYNVATATFVLSDEVIGKDFCDVHNTIGVQTDSSGYLYVYGGGRSGFTNSDIWVWKSGHTIDDPAITVAGFTDLNAPNMGARGYKYMVIDDNDVIHLLAVGYGTNGLEARGDFYIANHLPGTGWSAVHKVYTIEITLPTYIIPANNSYVNEMVLGKETSGQKSLHLAFGWNDTLAGDYILGCNQKLCYMNLMYQPATRNYKVYKADGTEITGLPADSTEVDIIHNGLTDSYYSKIRGGLAVLPDNTPVIVNAMLDKAASPTLDTFHRCFKWNSGASTWDTSTVHTPISTGVFPRLTENNGTLFVQGMDLDALGHPQVATWASYDAGATWGATNIRTTEVETFGDNTIGDQILYQLNLSMRQTELRFIPRYNFSPSWASGVNTVLKRA